MIRRVFPVPRGAALVFLALAACLADDVPATGTTPAARQRAPRASTDEARPQPRPRGTCVAVDPARIGIDDGDSITIRWTSRDTEVVRILGIDAPETRHLEHDIPYAQSFGPEARAFAEGAFGAATRVELLRAATLDPYGRTLGYVFVNGLNYSVLLVEAHLAWESVSHYGDNGFPREAGEVLAAAQRAGTPPFEPPHLYRRRMRDVSRRMKEEGTYPER
jgi:micrococcal nuclease